MIVYFFAVCSPFFSLPPPSATTHLAATPGPPVQAPVQRTQDSAGKRDAAGAVARPAGQGDAD